MTATGTSSRGIRPCATRRGRLRPSRILSGLSIALALAAIGPAVAQADSLILTSPQQGAVTNNQTPPISGTNVHNEEQEGAYEPIVVHIFAGRSAIGVPMETMETREGPEWTVRPASLLAPGTYTAQAEPMFPITSLLGTSQPVNFTIDTTAPHVTITSPANGSATTSGTQGVSGSTGTEAGDLQSVTVELFAGASPGSSSIEALTVGATGHAWSATFSGLSPGTYTAVAHERDEAGNEGASAPRTFTVLAPAPPPPPPPPAAAFSWVPSNPQAGEAVTLISNSTDLGAPITALAWSTTPGTFIAGGPLFTTIFAKAGAYPVSLRITDSAGRSSVASQTIHVTPPALILMQPFPLVRIAGSLTSNGVNIASLSVLSLANTRVTVTCRGHGCPRRSETHIAHAVRRGAGSVLVSFRRFARSLPAGVVLEVRVSMAGQIGKYTRFAIHRRRLPTRVDECLESTSPTRVACPS